MFAFAVQLWSLSELICFSFILNQNIFFLCRTEIFFLDRAILSSCRDSIWPQFEQISSQNLSLSLPLFFLYCFDPLSSLLCSPGLVFVLIPSAPVQAGPATVCLQTWWRHNNSRAGTSSAILLHIGVSTHRTQLGFLSNCIVVLHIAVYVDNCGQEWLVLTWQTRDALLCQLCQYKESLPRKITTQLSVKMIDHIYCILTSSQYNIIDTITN